MGEVVALPVSTSLDIPADRVLRGALDHGMDCVVVLGIGTDGESYFASSAGDSAEIVWLMELAKKQLLEACS